MTTISVAMTTYNGARFVREQLDSIARQTVKPVEIVVTDDGSTDATIAVIEDFAREAPFPVRIHRNEERLGFRANFFKSIFLCEGDLIAFCDQDDAWVETKLEILLKAFDDPSVLVACHNALLMGTDGRDLGRKLDQFPHSERFTYRTSSPLAFSRGFTQIIRRELFLFRELIPRSKDLGDAAEIMSHDQWFFFLALLFGSINYISDPLTYYRQHENNWSGLTETPGRKFVRRLSDRKEEYRRLVVIWENRCQLLDLLAADLKHGQPAWMDKGVLQRLEEAKRLYAGFWQMTERRRAFYDSESKIRKLGLWADALLKGDYKGGSAWRFTRQGAVRDLVTMLVPVRE